MVEFYPVRRCPPRRTRSFEMSGLGKAVDRPLDVLSRLRAARRRDQRVPDRHRLRRPVTATPVDRRRSPGRRSAQRMRGLCTFGDLEDPRGDHTLVRSCAKAVGTRRRAASVVKRRSDLVSAGTRAQPDEGTPAARPRRARAPCSAVVKATSRRFVRGGTHHRRRSIARAWPPRRTSRSADPWFTRSRRARPVPGATSERHSSWSRRATIPRPEDIRGAGARRAVAPTRRRAMLDPTTGYQPGERDDARGHPDARRRGRRLPGGWVSARAPRREYTSSPSNDDHKARITPTRCSSSRYRTHILGGRPLPVRERPGGRLVPDPPVSEPEVRLEGSDRDDDLAGG